MRTDAVNWLKRDQNVKMKSLQAEASEGKVKC